MKAFLTIFFSVVISYNSFAQDSDKVLARVRYTYINKADTTTQKGQPRAENMLLFLGKDASLYTSYDKINFEIADDQKNKAMVMARTNNNGAPTLIVVDRSAGDWLSKTNYIFFTKKQKMYIKEAVLFQNYLMEEATPEMSWKITKDTSTISGVACIKATTAYEGKNWEAWFSSELPFSNGPWKLHGLPGLIVEAYTTDKEIHYQFAGFENAKEGDFVRINDIKKSSTYSAGQISTVDAGMGLDVANAYFENIIQLPTYQTVKTTKELDKLKEAYQKDPKGFRKAQFGF